MVDFLLFRLHGPMSAWGDIAVGEFRPALDHPTRSAIMGLLSACLGYDRAEQARHQALNQGLYYGVRVDHPGVYLRDYHTVQFPKGKANRDLESRKHELAQDNLTTIITQREYICDATYTICLWQTQKDTNPTLEQIAHALAQPHWLPFLGRKSCPLGAPMEPKIIQTHTMKAALAQMTFQIDLHPDPNQPQAVYWDAHAPHSGFDPTLSHERRDVPGARLHARSFTTRQVHQTFITGDNTP